MEHSTGHHDQSLITSACVVSGPAGLVTRTVLPHEVMGGGLQPMGWDDTARAIRDLEQGRPGQEVVVRPGGQVEVYDPDQPVSGTITVLPHEVMAADRPYITSADLATLRRLDPNNIEGWTPVHMTDLDGWQFSMQSHPAGPVFVFLALRSPFESNKWRLSLLDPKIDTIGHGPHVITARLGENTTLPVLCLALGARPAADLSELRAQAAKWCMYHTRRLLGQDTIFSK